MNELRQVLEAKFPALDFCMAYGSGVFKQKDHDASSSMIDLVFAVKDPLKWHTENLIRNPEHYSFLRYFGANAITSFQENYGAGIYYNTLVPVDIPTIGQRLIKYGIIREENLLSDLHDWQTLYLSGRMHKPVHIMKSKHVIDQAINMNLMNALNYALLNLPEKFTEEQLYMKIAGISYAGDFRMTFGENPKKVRNIVLGNYEAFQKLYEKVIQRSSFVERSGSEASHLVADTSLVSRIELFRSMPANVQRKFGAITPETLAVDPKNKVLKRAVASIVRKYSRTQSLKGIVTAGLIKSSVYVAQKLKRTYFK